LTREDKEIVNRELFVIGKCDGSDKTDNLTTKKKAVATTAFFII